MADDDFEAIYLQEMLRHSKRPVAFETDMVTLQAIVGALQLSLRHPRYPQRVRPVIEGFLARAIDAVHEISPIIARGFERGNDPSLDVLREPRPSAKGSESS